MKSFKVGDRVRIVNRESVYFGREAIITYVSHGLFDVNNTYLDCVAYRVSVGGIVRRRDGLWLAYQSQDLEPIVNPDETAWNEFRRYLQPDPIILAKEPA